MKGERSVDWGRTAHRFLFFVHLDGKKRKGRRAICRMRWLSCLTACALLGLGASQQRLFDVKQLFRETMAAMSQIPSALENSTTTSDSNSTSPKENNELAKLLHLPSGHYPETPKIPAKEGKPEVEKKEIPTEARSSFKTWEDVVAEQKKLEKEKEEEKAPKKSLQDKKDGDFLSISRLIEEASKSLQAAAELRTAPVLVSSTSTTTAPAPENPSIEKAEILYRPVKQADGKILYEQMMLVKSVDGKVRLISKPNPEFLPNLPTASPASFGDAITSLDGTYPAPTFPPMVNFFNREPVTTTSAPATTPAVVEQVTPKVTEKKLEISHKKHGKSRQYASKIVELNEPIHFGTSSSAEEQSEAEYSSEQRPMRRRLIKKPLSIRTIEQLSQQQKAEAEENGKKDESAQKPEKRRRFRTRKSHKKSKSSSSEESVTEAPKAPEPASEHFSQKFSSLPSEAEKTKIVRRKIIRKRILKRVKAASTESKESSTEAPPKPLRKVNISHKERRLSKSSEEPLPKRLRLSHETDSEEEQSKTSAEKIVLEKPKKIRKQRKLVTRPQCLNIRSFARQFAVENVREFAQEHCGFIENYYPELKCSMMDAYMTICEKYYEVMA
ncbi:unnamed protein product [Caenorhabditis auriculariae]|uniref:aECM cysteine-cradle domain-containing protein n=1 Tax=Caenorhabditis auriculariae TaxID=2777116 RepID=A0A8S1HBX1_9PELO|nr:unnamed protein product [Caenorhabditis auriculariae]